MRYQESRMYRCGQKMPKIMLDKFYENSGIRKVVVDRFAMGTKRTIAEIELMGVKTYTKDTMLKIPSPSKKVVSLMFETVQNIGSFTNLGRQFHNSASYSTTEYPQDDGTSLYSTLAFFLIYS